jgi:acyl-coenzyme A synthetase/AMP-(fatty) acid ligase
MSAAPLVRGYGDHPVFAYREGRAVGVAEYLRHVAQVAAALPERRHLLNVCADRYHFAVGFGAALVRGQLSLLPPNVTPDLIERLVSRYPDVYCLSDQGPGPAGLETLPFPAVAAGGSATPAVPTIQEAQPAVSVFTSGSTGEPVPYRKTWGSLVRSALAELDRLGILAQPGTTVLGTVPPQHSYGLESTVLMVMQGGLAMHASRPFFPADIRTELESLPRPRCLVTTPTHLRVLLSEPDELSRVDLVLCATAPLSPQLAMQAESRFSAPLHEIYGCTEAGQIASRRTTETEEWRALAGVTLRADRQGTWVNGGHVESEILLSDVVELRGRGRFLMHGRTADLVNIAGKRTSLAHLNYHLNSIEGVLDGVFLLPEEDGDAVARLMAFVVAPTHTAQTLMNELRQRIDAAFLPRPLCFVEALPRSVTGKLPRRALDQIMSGVSAPMENGTP